MKLIKSFFLFFLISFSSGVFADTYPATATKTYNGWSTGQIACDHLYGAGNSSYVVDGACYLFSDNSTRYQVGVQTNYSCPYGGTMSSDGLYNCLNAPSCTSPQVRNITSGICQTPPTCTAPAVYDNPSNTCITPSCPTGKSRSPLAPYSCIDNPLCPSVLPLCSSTSYDCNNGDGTQQHIVQCSTVCPTGQHMDGGSCVDDKTAPVSCPAGFEAKNGSCEAAAPIVCPSGTRPGTVNGASVCASSSSIDPTIPRETDTHNTGTGTGTETTTTEHKDANGNVTGTSTSTTTSNTKIDLNTTGLASETTQKGILNALTQNGSNNPITPANTSGLDTAAATAESQANVSNPGSYFFQGFVVLPSASCQSVPMHYKALNYDFDPCVKLQPFRDMLGYFFYIITLIFIYQTATRPAGD